jgi:hypothetical protein
MYKSICRSCSHVEEFHLFPERCGDYVQCGCYGYIPSDNLEYLEWLYDKAHSKI